MRFLGGDIERHPGPDTLAVWGPHETGTTHRLAARQRARREATGQLEQSRAEPDYLRILISQNNEYGMLFLRTKLNAVPLDSESETEDSLLEGFEEAAEERGRAMCEY